MTTVGTLCYIINKNMILLKRASRGISKGKWNGPGGKNDGDETPEQNLIRAVFEETGLKISKLSYHGNQRFFLNGKNKLTFSVHLFSTKDFSGEIKDATDEGEVSWFDVDNIPYNEMWADDEFWMPLMLKGKKFDSDFFFNGTNDKIIKYEIRFK